MEFLSKESINSKELLKQINIFREMEYKEKEANNTLTEAQKKRGSYIELTHDNLLKIIIIIMGQLKQLIEMIRESLDLCLF